MAEEESRRSVAKDAAEGLRAVLQRIADFFDIFDLSFIISGAVTLAALAFWGWRVRVPLPPLPEGWIAGIAVIVACYVLGVLCFAIGRWFRAGWRAERTGGGVNDKFLEVLQAHGLSKIPSISDYLDRRNAQGEARLYVRLWAEIRQCPDLATSFYLLRRYWVMAATYDGMVVALTVWMVTIVACVFGLGGGPPMDMFVGFIIVVALIVSAVACAREAGRYVDYQIEELVASIAAKRAED
jgi:hypothetical protein